MIIAPYCCCEQPLLLEDKALTVRIRVRGWNGFGGVSGVVPQPGWVNNYIYTGARRVYSAPGYSRTDTEVFDLWNANRKDETSETGTPSFVIPTPPLTTTPVSATHYFQTYASGERFDYYLENPVLLEDILTAWRTRLQTLFPLETLAARRSITARASVVDNTLTPTDWDFPSIAGAHFNHITIAPTIFTGGSLFPWDETFYFVQREKTAATSPVSYVRAPVYGANPYFDLDWSASAGAFVARPPFYSSAQTSIIPGSILAELSFIRSTQRLRSGMNCDVSGYDSFTNYGLGDVALLSIDPEFDSFVFARQPGELALSPGVYSFDGRRMHIHSGEKLNPEFNVAGIDPSASPANYCGIVAPRVQTVNPSDSFASVPDYCPP